MAQYRGGYKMNNAANRNNLLGGAGGNNQYSQLRSAEQTQAMWEQRNNNDISELSIRVEHMKNLANGIRTETQSQNAMLDQMKSQFAGTSELLGNTLDGLGKMISSGGSKHMVYLIVFVVCIFFFLYYLLSMKS